MHTLTDTCRLIPSRYPSVGILDAVARPDDLALMLELEGWTNDRVSAELGILSRVPVSEWVFGRPMASVIMAAFCHPRPTGSRFNGPERGAWYAGLTLETAHQEAIFHRTEELGEIGVYETSAQVRLYRADFQAEFHDVRGDQRYHSPDSYADSQELAARLLDAGANGVLYRSVRHPGGECVACFRPKLVLNVRMGPHFEYRWKGERAPAIARLT